MPPRYIRVRAAVWAYGRGQTHRQTHRRAWPQYILRRLRLTQNVITYTQAKHKHYQCKASKQCTQFSRNKITNVKVLCQQHNHCKRSPGRDHLVQLTNADSVLSSHRRKGIQPVKNGGNGGGGHWLVRMEWRPAGWSVCLPLSIFPCTTKSRSSLLTPAHPGGPGKGHIMPVVVVVLSIHQPLYKVNGLWLWVQL